MLKLKADPTFTVPVDIPAPGGAVTIQVEYRHMAKDDYAKFVAAEKKKKRSDEDALMEIVVGWSGVDGEFSKESVRNLCQNYHGAASVIVETWIKQLTQYTLGN